MMEKMRNRKKKKGFTLIELIVVIAILAILVAIAVPRLSGFIGRGEEEAANANARTMNSATTLYEVQEGSPLDAANAEAARDELAEKNLIQPGSDISNVEWDNGDKVWTPNP